MSGPNRLQNFNQNQPRTSKTFRSSDSRRNNSSRMQQRGNNNNPNRMSINEGSNVKDGSNQGSQRFNRHNAPNHNASPNNNIEKIVNKELTSNARSKQNNELNWISYCQKWRDYILKGHPYILSPINTSQNGLNNYNNGSPTVGGNNRWENTSSTYSSVVGANSQPLPATTKPNANFSNAANVVSNTQASSPLLPMPTANVSPEAVNVNPVGATIKPIGASDPVNDSSHTTASVSSSNSYNYGQRYSDGYNRPRRGNYSGNKFGNQGGGHRYNGKGYSQNRNMYPNRFTGEHMPTQSYPPVVPVLHTLPYECHVPYADCQACFNSYVHPYPYGIPQFYPSMPHYVIAPTAHHNSFQDPSFVAAASSLPNTPSSTPSDASANSESLAQNALGSVKLPQTPEKAYQVNSGSFIGTEASQNVGISAVVPNAVALSRNVTPSMPQSGEQVPLTYYPQQVLIPANGGEMPGFVMDPQYINYVNDAGCIITPPVMYCTPNYAPELPYHNDH